MVAERAEQDQRSRTLQALERRFAVAKAEVQRQQLRDKRLRHDQDKDVVNVTSHTAVSLAPPLDVLTTPPTNTLSKKDLEGDALTYMQICQPVHQDLIPTTETPSKEKSTVDRVLHKLLQSGDSAQKYMQGSRGMKIDNWILLDNFVQGQSTSVSRLRALQSHSKRSKKHMSMKELKRHGALDLPKEFHKFELFLSMHEMWKGYVIQLLKNTGKDQVAQCLLAADLHGSILRVVECKIASFVGVVGIMIRETAETFAIITQENKLRVVSKRNSVFLLQAHCWKITICGDKFTSRKLGL